MSLTVLNNKCALNFTISARFLSLSEIPQTPPMKTSQLLICTAILFSACSSPSSTTPARVDSIKPAAATTFKEKPADNLLTDTVTVKAWLTKVIDNYLNTEISNDHFESFRKSLTDDYYNYKQDAINLEYDGSDTALTVEGFKKKWQGKFNTKYVGEGGYLVSAQDNGKVKVTIHLLRHVSPQSSLYKVIIEDLDYKSTYNRDMKVIAQDGKLLIADILEYN
jgi:PBP1b-binding outer membrane lipoprotein LpoB